MNEPVQPEGADSLPDRTIPLAPPVVAGPPPVVARAMAAESHGKAAGLGEAKGGEKLESKSRGERNPKQVVQNALSAGTMLACTLLLLLAGAWDYAQMARMSAMRGICLAMLMVIGVLATLCLTSAMYSVINILRIPGLGWTWRMALRLGKRGLLVLQLATMGVALLAGVAWVFNMPLPVRNDPVLHPGWEPPAEQM